MLADFGQIRVVQHRIDLPGHLPTYGVPTDPDFATQFQLFRQAFGRGRHKAKDVAIETLFKRQTDVGKRECLSGRQFITPGEGGVMNRNTGLFEQCFKQTPIIGNVGRRIQRTAGKINQPVLTARQGQRRRFERDIGKTNLADQQRPPRQRGLQLRQSQCFAAGFAAGGIGGFAQHHFFQFHIRPESGPSAAYGFCRHIHAAHGGNPADDVTLIAFDIRHHRIFHAQYQRDQQQ